MDFNEVVSAHLGAFMSRIHIDLSLSETASIIGFLDNAISLLDSAQNELQADLDDAVTCDTYTSLLAQSDAILEHKDNLSSVLNQLNQLVG